MAVRQHLYRFEREGLVAFGEQRRPVGRPIRMWRLTDRAATRFPESHAELTLEMIAAVRSTFGEKGLDRLLAERSRLQLSAYCGRLRADAGRSSADRVRVLAALRREQGYMAEYVKRSDGLLLSRENHCPIRVAAGPCQGLCREELGLFRAALGPGARVERTDHLLAGASRCA